MLDPNEIVIHKKEIRVLVSYPLKSKHVFLIEAPMEFSGFSRAQVAYTISALYQYIYDEEEGSSETTAGNIPGLMNRETSHGRYGVWGHCLGELMLCGISFQPAKDLYSLDISS